MTDVEAPTVSEPSCGNCPSFLTKNQAALKFGMDINAPQCGRFGIVLGRPEMTEKEVIKIQTTIGARCDSYGVEVGTGAPEQVSPHVAKSAESKKLGRGDERTEHCGNCVNYIEQKDVVDNFGWNAGMCGAKGKLIPLNRNREFAEGCDYAIKRKPEDPKFDVKKIKLLDWYQYSEDEVTTATAAVDRELTDADKAAGIDGWIKIADVDGSRETFIPHFNPAAIDAEFSVLIPKAGDDEHPELYRDHGNVLYRIAVSWLELSETPIAWGPAGVGKTEVARHLAYLMGLPFFRFSITASTELDDLAGKMLYTPEKGTFFQYGRLPVAWEQRAIILLDEPNTAPPDVWQFLRPLTDNSQQMVLDINGGERIQRNKHAFMMLAANPAWDARNIGANTIGDADGSRLMHIRMELPEPKLEMEIIQARVLLDKWSLNDVQRTMITNIAKDIRHLVSNDTLPITWGLRNQIKVARSLRWFDALTAYRVATDNLDPSQQELILDSVRSHMPAERTLPKKGPIAPRPGSTLREREAAARMGSAVTTTATSGTAVTSGSAGGPAVVAMSAAPPVGIRRRP